MRNNEDISIGKALGQLLTTFQLADEVREYRVKKVLDQLFGSLMNNYLESIWLKDGVLTIRISSSTLRHELFLSRHQMKDRINEELGEKLVQQIILK